MIIRKIFGGMVQTLGLPDKSGKVIAQLDKL
jgi:hypothetical protein